MGYYTGQKITLKNAAAYVASDSKKSVGTKSGTFYIWSAATKCGRIRITNSKSNCGKTPAGKYVTCWINTTAISSGNSGSSSSKASTKAPTTQKTTTKKAASTAAKTTKKVNNNVVTTNIVEPSNVTPTKKVPGQIGYLGLVLFLVTPKQIMTLDKFRLLSSASYAEHGRHLKTPTVEFTGLNTQKISFEITLSSYLGTTPMSAHNKLANYMRKGIAVPFKLGKVSYGNYRWCITDLSFSGTTTDKAGNWTQAVETVSLVSVEKKG